MAQTEAQYAEAAESTATPANVPSPPPWSPDHFFKQRNQHRTCLFWFAIGMSIVSLLLLVGVVIAQIYFRVKINPDFEAISDQGLQILAVSVFGQILGVVYVIAKALWSNDEFSLMSGTKK